MDANPVITHLQEEEEDITEVEEGTSYPVWCMYSSVCGVCTVLCVWCMYCFVCCKQVLSNVV